MSVLRPPFGGFFSVEKGHMMGICTRVLLFDEFDWGYVGFDRNNVAEQVKSIIPFADLEIDTYKLMIFDIDKGYPYDLIGKVTCDAIMIMDDGGNFLPVDIDTLPHRNAAEHRVQLTALRRGWRARLGNYLVWLGKSLCISGGN